MAFNKRWGQQKSWRIFKNEDIKAFTILVVDEEWEKLWTMPRKKALELAADKWMDLVQVSYDPKTKICTAKVIDFGKYQYENKKLESEKRKKMKSKVQKEIKFGYNIWDHDLDMKVKKAIEFLSKGHPVKVNVVLKWREKMYKEIVRVKLDWVEEQLKEHGKSQWVKRENYWFTLVIAAYKQKTPQSQKPKKKKIAPKSSDPSKDTRKKTIKNPDNKITQKKTTKSTSPKDWKKTDISTWSTSKKKENSKGKE